MYRIVKKEALKPTVTLYEIEAPMVAKKAEPGQFIILRVDENGERIPITIHDFDREKGTVTIIVQTIGATTEKLRHKAEGEYIQDFVGPLGRPTETEGKKKVCVVGGGVGCAIAYPVLKKFHDCGAEVHAVVGFKNKDLVILEDKFRAASSVLKLMTDDGSYGEKGLVTDALKELIDAGNQYDEIFAIGPAIMMKFVSKTTEPYGIPTTVSMSPIMVDGTGICGASPSVARRSSPASTARTSTVTRSTGTRVSSAARCTSTGSATNTKRPATCSARRFSNMPNMSLKKNEMPSQEPNVRNKNFLEVALGYTEEQALDEAARCLNCKNHPCVSGCPVQVKIPEFIKKITEKDYEGAYQVIHETSSLPAVCGRVCPQETQCESKCIRGIKGEPVGIGRLERFVADWHNANVQEAPAKPAPNGHKVAVIGSGPSGLTCAGDLAKKGYDVTVFEALHLAGGVLVYGIPEFRLPKAIVQKEVDGLKALGVKVETNMVIGRVVSIDELMSEYGFEAVFIGSGAGLPMFMHIPGENLCGVYSANEFLTRINLMKAYKDGSDTPIMPLQGKKVAVVGGGNVAMDAARCSKRLGADVYVVYRRGMEELPARHEEVEHAIEEGIVFKTLNNPVKINGDEKGYVSSMTCVEMELGEPDASGRRRPIEKVGSEHDLPVDCVIMSLGTTPNPLIKNTTPGLEVNRKGGIVVNEAGLTSHQNVYAGGDAVTGAATVILAMGAGKLGAKSIDEALSK